MRSLFEECDWRPIEEAPLEEPVDVLVTDSAARPTGFNIPADGPLKAGSRRSERRSW
jgi:hypothetical protein